MDEFDIQYTTMADDAIDCATMLAEERNHAFVTPEHLLYELIVQEPFVTAIDWSGMDAGALEKGLKRFAKQNIEVNVIFVGEREILRVNKQ